MAALLVVAWAAPQAAAQRVQAFSLQDSIAVGERFELAVVTEHNFLLQPLLPSYSAENNSDEVIGQLGDVELIAEKHRGSGYFGRTRPGVRADTIIFEATTFALDTAFVPSISVPFVVGRDTVTASSRPFTIAVASHLPPDASDVLDLAPLASFPRAWWPWIMLAVFSLLVAGALVWLAILRRETEEPPPVDVEEPVPAPSPHEIASRRLRRLIEESKLDDPDHVKPFYVELVDIMRTYLRDRLHIPAHEMLTSELVRAVRRRTVRGPLPNDLDDRMHTVLSQADLIKFAAERSNPDTGRWAADETQALLDTIEASLPSTPSNLSEERQVSDAPVQ